MILLCAFASCQKVIQIDLNSKDPQIVIEAEVTDDTLTPQTVKITKSVNLSESNTFPTVSGASVSISDDAGNSVILNETSPGVYQNSTLHGYSGRTYYLTIVAEGKTYTSVCTMPAKVPLDSILVTEEGTGRFGPGGGIKNVTPIFQDPIGRGNYYRFKLLNNDTVSKSLFLFDDEVVDGGINNRSLNSNDIKIRTNDTVKIKMMCITKAVHLYFYSMSQNGSGPAASATPADPVTNIEGATLGYFSAHTVQVKQVIIQ
ncbi:MAG: DUF4249 domain-containing protein [Bacteroidia bacterium]